MRIEAQGKYMQSILEKACQTLAGHNMASGSYKGIGNQGVVDMGAMKDVGSPMTFPSLQDLHIYGGDQFDMQQQIDRPLDGFFPSNETLCLGKKRPNPYSSNGKSPMIWVDDLRRQELGSAAACMGAQEEPSKSDQLHIAPSVIDSGIDMDSMGDVYEAKPNLSGDSTGEKKFEGSSKLQRPSPRRAPLPVEGMNPMMRSSGLNQTRNLSYG